MASFAKIDENNIVLQVVKVEDAHEADGEEWLSNYFGGGTWKRCSFSGRIRGCWPAPGYIYDPENDIFKQPISSRTWPSWVMNNSTGKYEPPVAVPADGDPKSPDFERKVYDWDESITNWRYVGDLPEDFKLDEEDMQ